MASPRPASAAAGSTNAASSAMHANRRPRHRSGGSVHAASHPPPPPLKERRSYEQNQARYQEPYTLNSLWSVWYGTLAIAFQVYIIAKSVQRFTNYLSLPWPNSEPPYRELNAYVILTGIGVVILPFFVVATMMKIGNYANDGRKLGTREHRRQSQRDEEQEPLEDAVYANFGDSSSSSGQRRTVLARRKRLRLFRLIWRHSIPTGALLHALAALCFLVPRILMEAQLISYGFLPKGNIWKTEMDLILNHVEDGRVEALDFLDPINATERRWLEESLDDGQVWRDSILARRHPVSAKLDIEPGIMSPEFINLAVALFVIAVRYPSVFWATNKSFGFVFSLQLLISNLTILVAYSAFSVLYKVHVYGPERALLRYSSRLSLDVIQSALLAGLYIISLISSSVVLYAYGLTKYSEWKTRQLMRSHITAPSMGHRSRLWGYFPHFMAFISMALISLSAIPMMYDLILVYCGSLDSAALCGAAAVAAHLILWMVLWLGLTLKNSWNFSSSTSGEAFGDKRPPASLGAKGDTPLLVIDHGQTFQIRELGSKQAIRNLAARARAANQVLSAVQQQQQDNSTGEDVYWLRPKLPSPAGDKTKEQEQKSEAGGNSTLSWLRKKKQSPTSTKKRTPGPEDARPGSSKVKRKNSLGNLLGRSSKKDNELNEALGSDDESEYATLRSIVIRDETDENLAKATHMSLCPLKEEAMQSTLTRVFAPQPNGPNRCMNGDYELLVEHRQPQLSSIESPRHFSPIPTNEATYGQHRAFSFNSPVPMANSNNNGTYSPLKVQTHNSSLEQHGPERRTLGSVSSESSQSPEKNSDTSSGVHSGSSPNSSLTSDKRSASAENLALAKSLATTRATWKSSSLQRGYGHGPVEVKCPRVNFIPENPYQCEQLPPPMDMEEDESTMVIRRAKQRPQTEINCGQGTNGGSAGNNGFFSRATNLRMTSFTENPEAEDFLRDNSLPYPPQPRSLFDNDMRPTENPYGTYGSSMQCHGKTVVTIAPQMPPYPSSNNHQQQHSLGHHQHQQQGLYGQIEERDSANYSVSSSERESEFIVQLQKNFL